MLGGVLEHNTRRMDFRPWTPPLKNSCVRHCLAVMAMDSWPVGNELEPSVTEDPPCSDEAHFWLNGYVNKQNCRIWSEANPQVYVETPLHPEKLTVWCALWAGGILLQKR
ncbi:uncharacterized protein TNCV_1512891 [Trichonephila clavipes]|nr:uncharacterized protein TNCV_1512891 [Trichonephila clavipes]